MVGRSGGTSTSAVQVPGVAGKTVGVSGTFDGATVTIEGSMDATEWFTLNDSAGAAATFTSAGMVALAESPKFIRASVSAVGTPSVLVQLGGSLLV